MDGKFTLNEIPRMLQLFINQGQPGAPALGSEGLPLFGPGLVVHDKAEAPLRFAVSDHSFVVDGWVPKKRFQELRGKLEARGTYVETAESHDAHGEAEPPVQLRNPKPAKPFEFLIHLYSTPSYRELDPTLFLFIAAPFFFGFMIGDAGYGAIFIAMGLVASSRIKRESIWWRIFPKDLPWELALMRCASCSPAATVLRRLSRTCCNAP